MNANVEKAYEWFRFRGHGSVTVGDMEAFDAAGLLITPEQQACVEACKQFAEDDERKGTGKWLDCLAAGRAVLAQEAARKPVDRWQAVCLDGVWRVEDTRDMERLYKCAQNPPRSFTEREARAVCAALNAEARERS